MKQRRRYYLWASALLAAFVVWTLLLRLVDVQAIGPCASRVGFAALNGWVHGLTGVHMWLYTVTDWLGLVPIGVALSFAVLGLVQWIARKRLGRVDRSLFVLGGFYLAVMAVFVFFEYCVINYRPVLIEGYLAASYPSSTTLLVMCVMPTAGMQLKHRMKNGALRKGALNVIWTFLAFMVLVRLVSGVHWVSDIIGGALISASLVTFYAGTADAQS